MILSEASEDLSRGSSFYLSVLQSSVLSFMSPICRDFDDMVKYTDKLNLVALDILKKDNFKIFKNDEYKIHTSDVFFKIQGGNFDQINNILKKELNYELV
jgi:hypothetical protein